jgi:hypothetical protein
MARSPEWLERLPDILKRAAETAVPSFGVSRRDGFRLLHKFRARESGDTLAILGEDLVTHLDAIGAGETYQAYLRRAGEVGEHLRVARETASRCSLNPDRRQMASRPSFECHIWSRV